MPAGRHRDGLAAGVAHRHPALSRRDHPPDLAHRRRGFPRGRQDPLVAAFGSREDKLVVVTRGP